MTYLELETVSSGPAVVQEYKSENEYNKLIDLLDEWRNEDQEDSIILSRHQIILLLEKINQNDYML